MLQFLIKTSTLLSCSNPGVLQDSASFSHESLSREKIPSGNEKKSGMESMQLLLDNSVQRDETRASDLSGEINRNESELKKDSEKTNGSKKPVKGEPDLLYRTLQALEKKRAEEYFSKMEEAIQRVKQSQEQAEIEEESEKEIVISFAGDCTLGTDESFSYKYSFPYQFERQNGDYEYFFRGVQSIFMEDDLTLVNLETTFTTATKKAEKKFRFKGDPSYVNILKAGGIEMVNIANNHIYDYLEQGFLDTLKHLEEAGILFSGEGYISYYTVDGVTIGSIGYKGWHTGIKKELKADIERAREYADIVIVSFHWGLERVYYPTKVQKELGRFSIDCGADVVVGHHPHVIQGIELYKGKYIVYSLGNFCFGGNRNPSDKDTFIFQNIFTVKDGRIVGSIGKVIPCRISSVTHINDFQPTILEGKERDRVLDRIYEYSRELEYGIKKGDGSIIEYEVGLL